MGPEEKDQHVERLLDKAYNSQHKAIKERHGKKVADVANYGHGEGGDEDHTSIGTKIYGHGHLTTTVDHHTGEIIHDFDH